jgi:hypothetical protein
VNRSDLGHRLIGDALDWLRETYPQHGFGVERDVVWTLHRWLTARAAALGCRVWTDYPMVRGPRRALSADLAVVDSANTILSAAEFKFEPSHIREDVQKQKLPVIGWAGVLADIVRIGDWVAIGRAGSGWAVCVDEGGKGTGLTQVLAFRRFTSEWPFLHRLPPGAQRARHRHRVGVSVALFFALRLVATQGTGPAVRRPGLLAEACRRFGMSLGRRVG